MRLAAFNVENLFDRPKPMNLPDQAAGSRILDAHAELTGLLEQTEYTPERKTRILQLLDALGLVRSDTAEFAVLRRIRGRLLLRHTGGRPVEVVAAGRAAWIGWVELKTDRVNEIAISNTARVIRDVNADVLAVVEADNRIALKRFTDPLLRAEGGKSLYPHVMVIDGNDDRGIDVGLLSKPGFPIAGIRSHVDDTDTTGTIFSRDCPEYRIALPGGGQLTVLVNHFKSKLGGGTAAKCSALGPRPSPRTRTSRIGSTPSRSTRHASHRSWPAPPPSPLPRSVSAFTWGRGWPRWPSSLECRSAPREG